MNAAGPAEHILIEDETSSEVIAPETLTKRLLLDNRLLDSRTELAFYAEGFIRVRTGTAARMRSDHPCELNFLSPEPLLVRQIAWPWGAAALLALLAILIPAVLIPGLQAAVLTPVLVILGGAAVLFTGQFLRRSYVDYRFVTITGRVPVFALRASLGCLRGVRGAAAEVSRQIAAVACPAQRQDERVLRAEMRAHYQLRDRGVISAESCAQGTAHILSHFG